MATMTNLKDKLQTIARMNFVVPEEIELFPLALEMMDHIGSPDQELRDDLIYTSFSRWILKYRLFDGSQLRQLLLIALDDQHILYHVGEAETDSVFTRSFSVLILPLTLIANRERPFLNESDIHYVKDRMLKYLEKENDLRGYVEGKGWAHAVAHTGDAIDDLAQCPEMGKTDLIEILNAISEKMCFDNAPYIYDEDERMTTAVISVLKRQLLENFEIENWIDNIVAILNKSRQSPNSYCHLNGKNFLRCLYFRMRQKNVNVDLIKKTDQALSEINRYQY